MLVFCKARPVPYAWREKVERALDYLVKSDIVYSIKNSVRATPVPKHDGKFVSLCSDFNVTLNRAAWNECYALPNPEDIFSNLSGGKFFSKIDLASAYLQLGVGPKSQPLLTINTH